LKSSKSNFHATVVNALHALRLVHKTGVLYLTRHQDVCFFRKLRWLQSALYGINCSMVSGVLRPMLFEGEFTNCGDLKLPKKKRNFRKKNSGRVGGYNDTIIINIRIKLNKCFDSIIVVG